MRVVKWNKKVKFLYLKYKEIILVRINKNIRRNVNGDEIKRVINATTILNLEKWIGNYFRRSYK